MGLFAGLSGVQAQGWGCYAQSHAYGYRDHWREHVRVMKAAGMNTFATDCNGAADLRDLIDTAVEEEMLDGSVPVFIMYCGSLEYPEVPEPVREAARAAEVQLPGHGMGEKRLCVALQALARAGAKHPAGWPEFIGYNIDEPGRGEPMDEKGVGTIAHIARIWNDAGVRSGTAVIHPNVKNLTDALDILCVASINGSDLRGCRDAIAEAGKEFWVYDTSLRNFPPSMLRYHAGYWFWNTGAKVHLSWAWYEFQRDQVEREGWQEAPVLTDRLRAYRAGVDDYRRLEGLSERAQAERRAAFDWEAFPPKDLAEAKERTGVTYDAEPSFDFEELLPR